MLAEHRSRNRRYEGKWSSSRRSRSEPCANAHEHESRLLRIAEQRLPGRLEETRELSRRPIGNAWPPPIPGDLKRLQDDLKQIIAPRWPRAEQEHTRLRSNAKDTCEAIPHMTDVAVPSESSGTIAAVVREVTLDKVVAVAHGPSGEQEEIRLPLSLFARQPRPGTRVVVVLPEQPEREPSRNQAESALDSAYEELDALLAERHAHGPNPDVEQRIEMAWARLDALQEAACAEVRGELDASLAIPLDELERMLADVHAQLADDDE